MRKKTKCPYTFKDNFWSKKRVESGYTMRKIAKKLNMNMKTLTNYFTGLNIPDDDVVAAVCELFNVDFGTGRLEFDRAHRAYTESHRKGDKVVYSARKPYRHKRRKKTVAEIPAPVTKPDTSDIMAALYGKISYDEYSALVSGNISEVMPSLYGKVDFETYMALIKSAK